MEQDLHKLILIGLSETFLSTRQFGLFVNRNDYGIMEPIDNDIWHRYDVNPDYRHITFYSRPMVNRCLCTINGKVDYGRTYDWGNKPVVVLDLTETLAVLENQLMVELWLKHYGSGRSMELLSGYTDDKFAVFDKEVKQRLNPYQIRGIKITAIKTIGWFDKTKVALVLTLEVSKNDSSTL
jgi:hypothetical protein